VPMDVLMIGLDWRPVFLHNKSLSDGFGLLVRARDCSVGNLFGTGSPLELEVCFLRNIVKTCL
jgi:hypothetical protein